jgi:hypothetical protein
MTHRHDVPGIHRGDVLTICCGVAGSLLGYAGFAQLLAYGIYALALPGGLAGLAAGIPRSRAPIVPILCGVLATAAGVFTEHHFAPFHADHSLGYFLRHLVNLQPLTLVSILVGGLIGFWVPFRRRVRAAN